MLCADTITPALDATGRWGSFTAPNGALLPTLIPDRTDLRPRAPRCCSALRCVCTESGYWRPANSRAAGDCWCSVSIGPDPEAVDALKIGVCGHQFLIVFDRRCGDETVGKPEW